MNKHLFYYEKMAKSKTVSGPIYDKSTVYNGSTESPEDHPDFYKNAPKDYLPALKALSFILFAGIALFSAKYNSWKPSWEEHNWVVLKYYSLIFAMFWSAIIAVHSILWAPKNLYVKILKAGVVMLFSALFIAIGVYLVLSIIF